MASNTLVWIEDHQEEGIIIGVTDTNVSDFGDDDWEWSATFDRKNADILITNLRQEFSEEMTLKDMLIKKFGKILSTEDFVKYCHSINLTFEVKRMCV